MKKFVIVLMAFIMLLSLSACSNGSTNGEQSSNPTEATNEKTELKMGYQTDPEGLDPQRTAAASTFVVTNNIYDTLVGVTPNWEMTPRLAEKWDISEDGMEITFKLREDVFFQNGRQLKSSDVEFTFNRLKDEESPKARDYANIKEIKIIDDYNIKFVTEKLDVELLKSFAYPWTAVVPKEEVANLKINPVGTGPYKLKEWVPQQHIILEKNENYFGQKPKIETIKLELVPDATSLMAGLQVGDLDIIPLSGDQVETLKGNTEYSILAQPMNAVQIMSLNTDNKILSNEKVRQAIAMAINKDEIIEASSFGYGDKIGSHLPTTSPDYYDTNDVMEYNPEKAKELLKEAGYENGFDIKLTLPKNYQIHVDAGQVIADQLSKIGINANIELVEWGTWVSDVYGAKNFDMTVIAHTGRLDSYAFLSRYKSDSKDYISLKTGEVDELLNQALQELDANKRKDIYKQIQVILANKLPAIYIQTPYTMLGMQNNVKGMNVFPIDVYDFKDVYFQ